MYVMNKIVIFCYATIFILQLNMAFALAQESTQDSLSTWETTDTTIVDDQTASKKSSGFLSALTFWNNNSKPKTPAPWHQLAQDYMGVQPNEFYLNGYAKINEQWIPVLFVRRFKMMKTQYEHTLLIKGAPRDKPDISGIDIVTIVSNPDGQVDSYALRVQNVGFNFEMPVIPSVSRQEKQADEKRAAEIASMQLDFFGFEDYFWLENKSNKLRNVADTWQVSVQK